MDHNRTDRLSALLRDFAREENLSVSIHIRSNAYMTLRHKDQQYAFKAEEIYYLTSDGHYCLLHQNARTIRLRIPFSSAAAQILAQDGNHRRFLQISRGILINTACIAGHTKDSFLMNDGTALLIRRCDRARLLREFDTGQLFSLSYGSQSLQ